MELKASRLVRTVKPSFKQCSRLGFPGVLLDDGDGRRSSREVREVIELRRRLRRLRQSGEHGLRYYRYWRLWSIIPYCNNCCVIWSWKLRELVSWAEGELIWLIGTILTIVNRYLIDGTWLFMQFTNLLKPTIGENINGPFYLYTNYRFYKWLIYPYYRIGLKMNMTKTMIETI